MLDNEYSSCLSFPCDFPIKIMGPSSIDFQARILSILRKHTAYLGEAAIKMRHSKEGKYVSITATIPAESKEQLDNIYQELYAEEQVLMLL